MKSPFPGMDPYIEACGLWEDFHSHLVEKIGEKLADIAPDHYLIRTGFRYTRSIDYSKPSSPPLDAAETRWLKQRVQATLER
jgi:hypothetical protein